MRGGLAADVERLFQGDADGKRVVVVGLATDYCVKATALDAVRLGYETHLLTDAIAAVDLALDDGARAIEEMAAAGVAVSQAQAD